MAWYHVILVLIIILGIICSTYRSRGLNIEKAVLFCCAAILLFFAAMRGITVGADTRQYCWVFDWMNQTNWFDIPTAVNYSVYYANDQEVVYRYYNKILTVFFNNHQVATIANSMLLIGLISLLIYKQSKDKWLSIFLYFTLCFYQTALNLTPSSIASYACLCAIPFAIKKKPLPYFLIVGCAIFFHTSAVAFLPLYFLVRLKITPKGFWLTLILFFTATTFLYEPILLGLAKIMPSRYLWYLERSTEKQEQLLVWFVQLVLICLCWFLRRRDKDFFSANRVFFVIFLVESMFYFMAMQQSIFSRVSFLYSPYLIIAIPNMLKNNVLVKEKGIEQNRLLNHGRQVISLGNALVIMYLIGVFVLRISVNNVGKTLPYLFFWQ